MPLKNEENKSPINSKRLPVLYLNNSNYFFNHYRYSRHRYFFP